MEIFETGQVVRLKSGSPKMTVKGSDGAPEEKIWAVQWIDRNGRLQSDSFQEDIRYISFLATLALIGCQGHASMTSSIEPGPGVSMSLPLEFSESYKLDFQKNPVPTALRFLQAYDSFAKLGPVTHETVQEHAMLQASLERGQIMGGILDVDLNADGLISRIEYETVLRFPKSNKKAIRMAELFEFDENNDDLITFEEAVQYGQDLTARRMEDYFRPIESYLMLFDLNSDGRVLRHEVVTSLEFDLPSSESGGYVLSASRPLP